MYRSALDYYKRLLIRSWKSDNAKFELLAYEGMAMQYFYLENKPHHLELAKQCQDRYLKGHQEPKDSTVRIVNVELIKTKERMQLAQMQSYEYIQRKNLSNKHMWGIAGNQDVGKKIEQIYPVNHGDIKGMDRNDVEKLKFLQLPKIPSYYTSENLSSEMTPFLLNQKQK